MTDFKALLDKYDWESASAWVSELKQGTRNELKKPSISTTGVHFVSAFVIDKELPLIIKENGETAQDTTMRRYGGFFYPITPENREEAIKAMLPDDSDWLLNALAYEGGLVNLMDGKSSKQLLEESVENMTPEQKAFFTAYHRLNVGFLTANQNRRLRMDKYVESARDDTLTDKELYEFFHENNFLDDIEKMGALGKPFIQLVGGEWQGRIDFESERHTRGIITNIRYNDNEFEGYHYAARKAVAEMIKENPALRRMHDKDNELSVAVAEMENRCGSDSRRIFQHTQPSEHIR